MADRVTFRIRGRRAALAALVAGVAICYGTKFSPEGNSAPRSAPLPAGSAASGSFAEAKPEACVSCPDGAMASRDGACRDDRTSRLFRCLREMDAKKPSAAAEDMMLSAVESIKVNVSTNAADDSIGVDLIRQEWVRRVASHPNFTVFPTNAPACLALARYLGGVKCADFPSNLVYKAMPAPVMKSLNGQTISDERLRCRERDEKRKGEMRKQLGEAYRLQVRVFLANSSVKGYRRQLMSLCGRSVAGCKGVMTDEEFAAFTNEIVRISGADEQERGVLFHDLRSR